MGRKKRAFNDIVEDGCWDVKVSRLRGEDDDEEDELNVDQCVKCRSWEYLNADGMCDTCLKTNEQVVESGANHVDPGSSKQSQHSETSC